MLNLKKYSQRISIVVILFGIISLASCKVTFVPSYDSNISGQIDNTSKKIDKFYLTLLETTSESDSGRVFDKFTNQYVDIEVELNSLLNKNKIRPLNENSTRISEITVGLWIKYKEEHRADNTISNGIIKLNRKTFSDLLYAMQVAEKAKDIISNPPE